MLIAQQRAVIEMLDLKHYEFKIHIAIFELALA